MSASPPSKRARLRSSSNEAEMPAPSAPSAATAAADVAQTSASSSAERLAAAYHQDVADAYRRGGIDMAFRLLAQQNGLEHSERPDAEVDAIEGPSHQSRRLNNTAAGPGRDHSRRTSERAEAPSHQMRRLHHMAAGSGRERSRGDGPVDAPQGDLLSIGRQTLARAQSTRRAREPSLGSSERQRDNSPATFTGLLTFRPAPQQQQRLSGGSTAPAPATRPSESTLDQPPSGPTQSQPTQGAMITDGPQIHPDRARLMQQPPLSSAHPPATAQPPVVDSQPSSGAISGQQIHPDRLRQVNWRRTKRGCRAGRKLRKRR